MKRVAVTAIAGVCFLIQAAAAQSPPPPSTAASQAAGPQQGPRTTAAQDPTSEPRPDAKYPKPSGQDSQPHTTTPKRATPSGQTKGDPEGRGSQTAKQSSQVQQVTKRGTYRGDQGKKKDPGTACSNARSTPNGGLDCGLSGEGATPGKNPVPDKNPDATPKSPK